MENKIITRKQILNGIKLKSVYEQDNDKTIKNETVDLRKFIFQKAIDWDKDFGWGIDYKEIRRDIKLDVNNIEESAMNYLKSVNLYKNNYLAQEEFIKVLDNEVIHTVLIYKMNTNHSKTKDVYAFINQDSAEDLATDCI